MSPQKPLFPVLLSATTALIIGFSGLAISAPPAKAPAKPAPAAAKVTEVKQVPKKTPEVIPPGAVTLQATELLKSPDKYLNKPLVFEGTFNRFADIGLDYKKAMRDSKDYVSFFILRPDVSNHTIPMAELKLFFPRKKSDEVMELESGDKIRVIGTEFSSALGMPWVDVDHITILQKTAKSDKREESPEL